VTRYFAYGSNMSAQAMQDACPGHRLIGRARLPGHRLAFTRRSVRTGSGVADILADPGSSVWGVLYELSDEDLDGLDEKEGAGWAYDRLKVRVFGDDGSPHDAVAYVVIEKSSEEIPPSARYARQLIDAGRERGLSEEYLDAVSRLCEAQASRP
jgi:gamma-glutamylcyclotransferase